MKRYFCLIVTSLAALAQADTVVLKNGQRMEGVIKAETAESVTLNFGVGDITLSRSKIASIERDEASRAKTEAAWKKSYFADARFAPERFADLAAAYREVEALRPQAFKAASDRRSDERKLAELIASAEVARQEVSATSRRMAEIPKVEAGDDPLLVDLYNERVKAYNDAQARLIALLDDGKAVQDKLATESPIVGRYVEKADRLRGRVEKDMTPLLMSDDLTDDERTFVGELVQRTSAFAGDVQSVRVPFTSEGEATVIDVTINGTKSGKFILDTGASMVVMGRAFAGSLLDKSGDKVKMRLADGTVTDADALTLKEVKAGGAVVHNVAAAVLDESPGPGIDGLLGMTFLQDFIVHFDASSGTLELLRLKND